MVEMEIEKCGLVKMSPNESTISVDRPKREGECESFTPASDTSYASAGVNIDAGNRAVELMRGAVRSTYGKEVLAGIGAFGGFFESPGADKVLVASADGQGPGGVASFQPGVL